MLLDVFVLVCRPVTFATFRAKAIAFHASKTRPSLRAVHQPFLCVGAQAHE